MRSTRPQRVVVVGGGVAGLLAAAAAAPRHRPGGPPEPRTVVVVDRDRPPAVPAPRRGVPQGAQPHVLLQRGQDALEALLPGVHDDSHRAGAVALSLADVVVVGPAGRVAGPPGRHRLVSMTRPLLEEVLRQRVAALPAVQLRDGAGATGLRRRGGRWCVDLEDGSSCEGDLVVDASGRSSRLPVWLERLGVPPARTEEVDSGLGYATRSVRTAALPGGARGALVLQTPGAPTGALLLPVEGGRWVLGVTGAAGHRPPRDAGELDAFIASLHDPVVAQAVTGHLEGPVAVHRQTANRRHHYGEDAAWPAGLLVVGDALCAVNPVHGQGMTIAACQALALRAALAGDPLAGPLTAVAGGRAPGGRATAAAAIRLAQRAVAQHTALAWRVATGVDLSLPGTAGRAPRGTALVARWADAVGAATAAGEERAGAAVDGVYHLVAPPTALVAPGVVAAVARTAVRRRLARTR